MFGVVTLRYNMSETFDRVHTLHVIMGDVWGKLSILDQNKMLLQQSDDIPMLLSLLLEIGTIVVCGVRSRYHFDRNYSFQSVKTHKTL